VLGRLGDDSPSAEEAHREQIPDMVDDIGSSSAPDEESVVTDRVT
jgi:hypothetical protein